MKILTTIIALTIIFACKPIKPSDANGNQIMAKFVKDDYGNIYKLDICKSGNFSCTCLVPVDTHEYKIKVFENKN